MMMNQKLFTLSFIFIFSTSLMYAQEVWREYTWEQYNIVFELPNRFDVTTNSEQAMEASGPKVKFGLYPVNDDKVQESNMESFLLEKAKESYDLDDVSELMEVDFEGFVGGFVTGLKGKKMYALLFVFDPETKTKFYAISSFDSDDLEVFEIAIEVFGTFRRIE